MELRHKNSLEWAVFAVSVVLVFGTMGYLGYEALTRGNSPPSLAVHLGKTQRSGQGSERFLVPVTVFNRGDATASNVQVRVLVERAGQEVESNELTMQFLPSGSSRQGWVAFRSDPARGKMKSHVLGYEEE